MPAHATAVENDGILINKLSRALCGFLHQRPVEHLVTPDVKVTVRGLGRSVV